MKKLLSFAICAVFLVGFSRLMAQDSIPMHIRYSQQRSKDGITTISIKAVVEPGVKLFTKQKGSEDLLFSVIKFDSSIATILVDSLTETGKTIVEKDSTLNANVHFVTDSIEWQQKLKLPIADSLLVKGIISFSYKKGDEFLTGEQKINTK